MAKSVVSVSIETARYSEAHEASEQLSEYSSFSHVVDDAIEQWLEENYREEEE